MYKSISAAIAGAAMNIGAVSAQAQDVTEKDTAAPQRGAAWHNTQQAALAERTFEDGWRYIDGGLLWRRTEGDGSGARPTVQDTVTIHYAGTFVDGTGFDSSYDRGEPATFPLGALIPAWQLSVPEMGIGDTIEIAAPASLAYGLKGRGPIPGGATLLFKIELFGIEGK